MARTSALVSALAATARRKETASLAAMEGNRHDVDDHLDYASLGGDILTTGGNTMAYPDLDSEVQVSSIVTQLRLINQQKLAVDLPSEVLVVIFEIVCLSDVYVSPTIMTVDLENSLRQNRFIVTSTCHRWREVALATSSLWSHVMVRFLPHKYDSFLSAEPSMPNPVPPPYITSITVARARSRPLSLYATLAEMLYASAIHETQELYERDISFAVRLIQPLLGQCVLLRLKLYIRGVTVPISTLFNSKTSAPHLRFLYLIISGEQTHVSAPEIDLSKAYHLEDVRLSIYIDETPIIVVPPSEQNRITRLQISGKVPFQSIASALGSCPSLHTLEWADSDFEVAVNADAPRPTIILPCLRSLKLCGFPAFRFLSTITAPGLDYLYIETNYVKLADWFDFHHPYPNVRRLFIQLEFRDRTPIDRLLLFIRSHPNLNCLGVSNPEPDILRFSYQAFAQHPGPVLIVLDIRSWRDSDYGEAKTLLRDEMMQNTQGHGTQPLRVTTINASRPDFVWELEKEFPELFRASPDRDNFDDSWSWT